MIKRVGSLILSNKLNRPSSPIKDRLPSIPGPGAYLASPKVNKKDMAEGIYWKEGSTRLKSRGNSLAIMSPNSREHLKKISSPGPTSYAKFELTPVIRPKPTH